MNLPGSFSTLRSNHCDYRGLERLRKIDPFQSSFPACNENKRSSFLRQKTTAGTNLLNFMCFLFTQLFFNKIHIKRLWNCSILLGRGQFDRESRDFSMGLDAVGVPERCVQIHQEHVLCDHKSRGYEWGCDVCIDGSLSRRHPTSGPDATKRESEIVYLVATSFYKPPFLIVFVAWIRYIFFLEFLCSFSPDPHSIHELPYHLVDAPSSIDL